MQKILKNFDLKRNAITLMYSVFFIMLIGLHAFIYFTNAYRPLDFYSLYAAETYISKGLNPYQDLKNDFDYPRKPTNPVIIPVNLNPPFFLWLYSPLVKLHFSPAMFITLYLNLFLGLSGAFIMYKILFPSLTSKKDMVFLLIVYLASFFNFINAFIVQLSSFLIFFIMLGYYFYDKKYDIIPGLCWGFIAVCKLFPLLLVIFALIQKRYKVLFWLILTFLLLNLVPLFIYGPQIFINYFKILPKLSWYGDSWNASLYGFIFRASINSLKLFKYTYIARIDYFICFFLITWAYIIILRQNNSNKHFGFALTLITMLILSPFAWVYYLVLLMFPLFLSCQAFLYAKNYYLLGLFFFTFFFLNFPLAYNASLFINNVFMKLTLHSCYFYGLLLTGFLLLKANSITVPPNYMVKLPSYFKILLVLTLYFSVANELLLCFRFYFHTT